MHIIRIISRFILIFAVALLFPLIVAYIYNETDILHSFFIPILVCILVSGVLMLVSWKNQATFSIRTGFIVVTVCWVVAALVGSLPFYISGTIPLYADAFFESMSGFTTTGASILSDIESLPRAILFWRSLTHWLGGMGIIALVVALFPLLGSGGNLLLQAELPGLTVDKIVPKIAHTAKILWIIYLSLTALETIFLMIGGMNLFDALTHTFGTLATGGFSTKNASVGHWNSPFILMVITFFMLCAGTNFNLMYKLSIGNFKALLRDNEWRVYIGIFVVASAVITITQMRAGDSFLGIIFHAGFQSAAILTTTGYATTDYVAWSSGAQAILLVLMFCGGCAGSTGGGIKIIRLLILAKQGTSEIKHILHPKRVFGSTLGNYSVNNSALVQAVSGFVALYIMIVLGITVIIAGYGYDLLTSLTTALATLGNIGPGFGMISPTSNYSFYPASLKYFISVIMLCGRLEIFTVLILCLPRFWQRR